MIFNLSFDSSVNSAPAAFRTVVNAAAAFLQSTFTDNVTVNVTIGYGEVGGLALSSGALGESLTQMRSYSYSQVRTALNNDALSPDDHTATAQLPVTDPAHADIYSVSTAEAKALGLSGASTAIDGSVGFTASNLFDFTTADGISAGRYDFYGVVVHELTEIMGRTAGLGEIFGGQHSFSPMDLFRYSAAGVRDFSPTHSAYLSPDGGTTHLVPLNTNASGDLGDWAASAGADAFLAFANSGVVNPVTAADLRVMDLIGWNVASSGSNPPPPTADFDSSWTLGAVADFNGDHRADLIWSQNQMVGIQMLNASVEIGRSSIPTGFDAAWRILGAGDFNGDGSSDLAWVRSTDGLAQIQFFNGTTPTGGGVLSNSPFNTWAAVGIGDFNQDGRADLIFQRPSDGVVEVQLLNGTTGIGGGLIANNSFGLGWHVVAAADFNGDHSVDLIWQHQSDGVVEVQLLNGMSAISAGPISNNPFGADWTIAGTGDFNGDGSADLVWQRTSDHLVEIQFLHGTQAVGGGLIAGSPFGSDWTVQAVGDVNGDGKADLVYRHAGDGLTEVQLLNGNSAQGGGVISHANTDSEVPSTDAGTFVDHDAYLAQPTPDPSTQIAQSAPPIGGWTHDLLV